MRQTLQPYEATFRSIGVDAPTAVQYLLNADHRLRYGSPQEKLQMFAQLARDYQVPLDALMQAGKAAGRTKGLFYVFERDAVGLWWILFANARVHFQPIDGSFPDGSRIIPTAPETETAAHYQPQYVTAMGAMAKALRDNKKGDACLFHIHQAGEGPALVTFPNEDSTAPRTDCCAVLMPMRSHHTGAKGAFDTAAFLNH